MKSSIRTNRDETGDGRACYEMCRAGVEFLFTEKGENLTKEKVKGVGRKSVIEELTLQKSMDFTPLDPRAGPTGGEGDACPAPTSSLTIWSRRGAFRAIVVKNVD